MKIPIPKYVMTIFHVITIITIIFIIGGMHKWLFYIVSALLLFYVVIQVNNDRCSHCSNYIDEKKIYNKFNGKCEDHFMEYYHKNHKIKDDLNVKCRCDIVNCKDCLLKNCKDIDCPIHTNILKNKEKEMKA